MSNEEKNSANVADNHTDIDKSKRKFSKAGLVAPVILTLASKPVFAVQGLSNMISGNGSNCRGDNFQGGFSHGFYKKPKATNGSLEVIQTALSHLTSGTGKTFDQVTIADAFTGHSFPPNTSGTDTLISVVRKDGTPECQIVAGYLNLYYYVNSGGLQGQYFMSTEQFWALNDGDTTKWAVPAGYTDFVDLIEKNMGGVPGDTCNADGTYR